MKKIKIPGKSTVVLGKAAIGKLAEHWGPNPGQHWGPNPAARHKPWA